MVTQAKPAREFVAFDLDPVRTDPGLCALSPIAQIIDYGIRRDSRRSHAGDVPIRRRAWQQLAPGITIADVNSALDELEDAGRILIDPIDEVVLIRGWIAGQRGIFKWWSNAIRVARDADAVNDPQMRAELGAALAAIPVEAIFVKGGDTKEAEIIRAAKAGVEWATIVASLTGTPQQTATEVKPGKSVDTVADVQLVTEFNVPSVAANPIQTTASQAGGNLADTLTSEYFAGLAAGGQPIAPGTPAKMRTAIAAGIAAGHDVNLLRRALKRQASRCPLNPGYFTGSITDVIEHPGIEDAGDVTPHEYQARNKRTAAAKTGRPASTMFTNSTLPASA